MREEEVDGGGDQGELEDDGVQLGADVDGGGDHVEVVEGGSSSSMWRTCHGPVSWPRSIESLLVLIALPIPATVDGRSLWRRFAGFHGGLAL